MIPFRQRLVNFAAGIYFRLAGNRLKQEELSSRTAGGEESELLVRAAAEGAVLLKNDGTLPARKIALFGRAQTDTFYTGYGSGGDVNFRALSILEGLEGEASVTLSSAAARAYRAWTKKHPADRGSWGNWPYSYPEMPLSDELVHAVREECDTAVVVIGRAAGEDRDAELEKGCYYLSDGEREMLSAVKKRFDKVAVLLNVGALIDLAWLEEFGINAALLVWQGGGAAGRACAKLLCGEWYPCGKLPDTAAREYCDYPSSSHFGNMKYNEYYEDIYVGYRYFTAFAPEKALYPFGFGLGYTTFSLSFSGSLSEEGGRVSFVVKNTGDCAGREVVQVYVQKPRGAARELVGFYKTKELAPGQEERGEIRFSPCEMRVYDEESSSYLLQAGNYVLYAGTDCTNAEGLCAFTLEKTIVIEKLSEQCAPEKAFRVLAGKARAGKRDLKGEMLSSVPPPFPRKEGKWRLSDVAEGKLTLEEFVSTLSPEELEAISRGDYTMDSPLGAKGNAGVMGGVLPSLREKGIPPVAMTDGPSGIRLKAACSLVPVATCLAATFDPERVGEVYALMGEEMKERGSHVLLAPAMNLHRNPLCGRNFEYFSEDPFLTGKIAAGAVRGLQKTGVSACIKHFACNNQELNRNRNDSRVSERALRELYLRGFEICIKESSPHLVMTSYNKINGVWAHYHFSLVRGILRGEWQFKGCVITDWWMRKARCPQFRKLKNNAYRVRAGVNVLMPGGGYLGRRKPDGSLLKPLGKKGGIALSELQQNAVEILNFILHSAAYRNGKGEKESVV